MLGGVAAGLAEYLDADPALIRIAWVALILLTSGLALLAYLAAWALIPEAGESDEAGEGADGPARGVAGAASGQAVPESARVRRHHRRRGSGGIFWGVLLVLIGVVALLRQLDVALPPVRAMLAGALVLVGLAMIAAARRRMHGGLLVLGLLLVAALAARVPLSVPPGAEGNASAGDRRVVVSAPADLETGYNHAFGSMRLEIADAALPAGTTALAANIAFGSLQLAVPQGVGVRVTANTVLGSARVLDTNLDGLGSARVVTSPGYEQAAKRLDIHLNTAFGSARIERGAQ